MVAPIVPGLTDHELENILTAAADAGAVRAGYLVMRLPHEIKDLFREWLEENAPERASRIMSQIHQLRGGRDNDPRFFTRLTGEGENARLLAQRFDIARRKLGLNAKEFTLDASQFQPPYRPGQQITLF
jgi:DNA repair photolyase